MATHSNILVWRIPWTEEAGGLQSIGSHPIQFSSVTQSCLTLCDPMDCSTSGFPEHHQILELAQTHVHWIGDAIQPSHPLLFPSSPTFRLSQHQDIFKWVSSSHKVAKLLEFQLQHQAFQWIFRVDFLENVLVGSSCYTRTHKGIFQPSVLSFLYSPILTSIHDHWKNHSLE